MRIHHPLDKILNNEMKVKILRFLCKTDVEWSGRQIAREMKVSPAACHKILKELHQENILLVKNVGKSYLYCLNKENIIVLDFLKPIFERENRLPDELDKVIVGNISSGIINNIVAMFIQGNRGNTDEKTNINLLILVRHSDSKSSIKEDFSKLNEKIIRRFGNLLSSDIQTVDEFKSKFKGRLSLVNDIQRSHRLLLGNSLEEILFR